MNAAPPVYVRTHTAQREREREKKGVLKNLMAVRDLSRLYIIAFVCVSIAHIYSALVLAKISTRPTVYIFFFFSLFLVYVAHLVERVDRPFNPSSASNQHKSL